MNRSRKRRRGGFTLVEVLLVLVILVVMASIAVVAIAPAQKKAYTKTAATQIHGFESFLDQYRLDIGEYPTTAQGLDSLYTAPSDLANPDDWAGPYLKKAIPLDPWKRPYQYEYPGQHDQDIPDIWSLGADGVNGTDDDVVSWVQN